MKFAPLYKRYPELELFRDDVERSDAMKRAHWRSMRQPMFWFGWVAVGVVSLVGATGLHALLVPRFSAILPRWMIQSIGLILVLASAQVWSLVGWDGIIRRMLRKELISCGIRVCLNCGYDLRGQTEPRCPECGHAFERTSGNP